MVKPLLRVALPVILAGTCALAHADIYTWTDETGRVNISNLEPPEGVKVTRVVHETAPKVVVALRAEPPPEALRDTEVRLLADRVRQLQDEVDAAKRQAVREAEYRMTPPPAPAVIQYIQAPAPPVQYASAPAPASANCGFGFDYSDCGFGWGSGFYPGGYIVVNSFPYRRGFPGRGDNPIGPRPPMQQPPHHAAPWMPIVSPGMGRGR